MSLTAHNVEWKYVKSYATEKALMKSIDKEREGYTEYNDRFIVVKTPEDRWTAIVQLDNTKGGYIGRYPFLKV